MTVLMPVDLVVQHATTSVSVPGDELFKLWAETVLAGRTDPSTLTIRIVDESEAQRFNRDYRDRDYATNVLSFPSDLPAGLPVEIRKPQLGDLLICAPVVAREALQQHRQETDHWAHLTIHGILHLLGYDHLQAEDALAMESLETEILQDLGISDPYQDLTE